MHASFEPVDDWTAAYDNRAAVPTHEDYFYGWGRDAAAFRAAHAPETLAYGDGARERLDLFRPEGKPRGLAVFVHGGWWCHFGREYFSHMAAGPLAHGWAVAVPSYDLCPQVRIATITAQVRAAVERAAQAVADGSLALAGHSAGGHLVAMMGCAETALAVADRVSRIVAISALADLRPLMRVAMNETLGIDAAEARTQSPALLTPLAGPALTAWVGGAETPEFLRQNRLLAAAFGGTMAASVHEAPGENHFDVIGPLASADSALTRAVVEA